MFLCSNFQITENLVPKTSVSQIRKILRTVKLKQRVIFISWNN